MDLRPSTGWKNCKIILNFPDQTIAIDENSIS